MLALGYGSVTGGAKNSTGRLCEGVQYFETNVVAGFGVLGTDISQSYNQIFQLDKVFKELLFRLITYRAAALLLHHAKHELHVLRKLQW